MRKENIDHFFKYGTFPYGEWFEGSNKAAGKLPVATTLSLLDTVVVTRRRRRVTSFAFPFGGRANGRVYRQCRQRPQRTREPCTVRLRRRLLRALPLPAARAASVRLPPAARSPAACAPQAAARRTPA